MQGWGPRWLLVTWGFPLRGRSQHCKSFITINLVSQVFWGFVALTLKKLGPITAHFSVHPADYHNQHAWLWLKSSCVLIRLNCTSPHPLRAGFSFLKNSNLSCQFETTNVRWSKYIPSWTVNAACILTWVQYYFIQLLFWTAPKAMQATNKRNLRMDLKTNLFSVNVRHQD